MTTKRPTNLVPIRLYSMTYSGHGHRVQLLLSLLCLPYEKIDIEPQSGNLQTPECLARSPFGEVPVIIDGDATLYDSNAILVYLAKKYGEPSWLPEDPEGNALVQQWFSLAAGQIAFGPCAARCLVVYDEELVPMASAIDIDAVDAQLRIYDRHPVTAHLRRAGFMKVGHSAIANETIERGPPYWSGHDLTLKRTGTCPNVQFAFLGFTFRPRAASNRHHRRFTGFLPAVRSDALKRMRQRVRSWRMHRMTSAT